MLKQKHGYAISTTANIIKARVIALPILLIFFDICLLTLSSSQLIFSPYQILRIYLFDEEINLQEAIQMSEDFKLYIDALNYCKRFGLKIPIVHCNGFEIADALLCAYKAGAIQPASKADTQKPCRYCSLNAGDNFCANCGRDLRGKTKSD